MDGFLPTRSHLVPAARRRAARRRRTAMRVLAGLVAIAALWSLTGGAKATILYGPTDLGLASPDHFTSFDGSGLADNATIGSEFAADGFTFAGNLRFRPCGNWPNTAGGWTTAGYGASYGPGCSTNHSDDTFSILLSADADAASFTTHNDIFDDGLRIEVLKDGAVLETLDITEANDTWSNCCLPYFVRIEGLTFNEIRVAELSPTSQSWIAIDNLAFNEAVSVPEPGVAGVVALAALFQARRRRQTRSR